MQTGDNVLIGGFIVTGAQPKKVFLRAIGPSLNVNGVPLPGKLENPTLELDGPGGLIASNDDWRSTQEGEIIATGAPPTNDFESAIVATLPANSTGYTAIVRGVNNTTGIALVEAYDLDRTVDSELANISTRGLVQTGDNVMIGGFIVLGFLIIMMMAQPFFSAVRARPRNIPAKTIWCSGQTPYQYASPHKPRGSNVAVCRSRAPFSSDCTSNSSHARPGSFISATRRSR